MRHASARSKTGDAQSFPAFYEWKVEGRPLSIQLSFHVIDQIEADVMKGFWSVPKRGAEVGGVLFGYVNTSGDSVTVVIEDYEPVDCEYRRGPSYVFSDADKKRLERTLRHSTTERQVVGFYRSHTRLGLYLDQNDDALIRSYFPGANQVFLLVRPHASKASTGGFFFWEEDGTIRRQATYLEFPFSRAEILKHSGLAFPEPAHETAPAAPARRHAAPGSVRAPAVLDTARKRVFEPALAFLRRTNWRPVGIAALALVSIGALEYQLLALFTRRAPAPLSAEYLPALRIERDGAYLQVRWNRHAPSVLNAERAVLHISDGPSVRELYLDPRQLRTGSVAYAPASGDVNFRLELVGAKTNLSESLRVVEAAAPVPDLKPAAAPKTLVPVAAQTVEPARKAHAAPHTPVKRAARPHRRSWWDDGL